MLNRRRGSSAGGSGHGEMTAAARFAAVPPSLFLPCRCWSSRCLGSSDGGRGDGEMTAAARFAAVLVSAFAGLVIRTLKNALMGRVLKSVWVILRFLLPEGRLAGVILLVCFFSEVQKNALMGKVFKWVFSLGTLVAVEEREEAAVVSEKADTVASWEAVAATFEKAEAVALWVEAATFEKEAASAS